MSKRPRTQLVLRPRGPFSLEPVRTMACGFLRGTRACATDGSVTLAFPHDTTFAPVSAKLRMVGEDVHVTLSEPDPEGIVWRQIERFLALDHDATPFVERVSTDPVLAALWDRRPGFRPVVASSPYAMAGWCVLSQRTPMIQAAKLQIAMAQTFGDLAPSFDGDAPLPSFPRPESLLAHNSFPGISDEKWRRLQAIAAAALDGELDPRVLLARSPDDALARLRRIRGIGPWTAEAILIRGAGTPDVLPLGEPTLHAAVASAYGLSSPPSNEALERIAARWAPFRTWMSVLLIASLGRPTTAKRGAPREITKKPSKPLPPQLPLFLGRLSLHSQVA